MRSVQPDMETLKIDTDIGGFVDFGPGTTKLVIVFSGIRVANDQVRDLASEDYAAIALLVPDGDPDVTFLLSSPKSDPNRVDLTMAHKGKGGFSIISTPEDKTTILPPCTYRVADLRPGDTFLIRCHHDSPLFRVSVSDKHVQPLL